MADLVHAIAGRLLQDNDNDDDGGGDDDNDGGWGFLLLLLLLFVLHLYTRHDSQTSQCHSFCF